MNSLGKENGYFCDVRINDNLISCLCDSGANVSILDRTFFNLLNKNLKIELIPVDIMMSTVTGENKPFIGKAKLSISLGGHTFNHEMLIADVNLNGILGLDFMKQHNCDVMISKNYLTVKSDKIPCYTKSDGKMNCCRVSI